MYRLDAPAGLYIILMRHSKTALNDPANPSVRGWKDDPLTPEGRIAAQLAAQKLKPYDPKLIFHSDFMRDAETAHIVAASLLIPTEPDYDARTWDVGQYSGKPEDEVNPAIMRLYRDPWKLPPGSQETFDQFSRRWLDFLERKMQYAIRVAAPIVIVTHGRNIALTQAHLAGLMPWDARMPLPAGLGLITVAVDGEVQIELSEPSEKVIDDV